MSHFTPKSLICWREGISRQTFLADLLAGFTVGIVALPLAMAFGIASIPTSAIEQAARDGVTLMPPAMGLATAIVAGFLISLLGGSRVQIGGPTGAFIVIVYGVCARHGYAGLAAATFLAGFIVILMGVCRLGSVIKYIPYPVITGFTSGIAVIIFSSQVKDLLGLEIKDLPAEFVPKWIELLRNFSTINISAVLIAGLSLAILLFLRKKWPRVPGAVVVVVITSLLVSLLSLPVPTIGSRYGEIPQTLPIPHLPTLNIELIRQVFPDAITIAILIAIESLLSAAVADGMTGRRHKADAELVGQGVANIASIVFGGIPATGAIARTATNIKSGAQTPLAGMIHAVTLLFVVLCCAPLASRIPLPALAAVLVIVAWNMSEFDQFRSLLRAPQSDRAVLLTTFLLTVFVDLTVAVGVGLLLACLLFIKRMADITEVSALEQSNEDEDSSAVDPNAVSRRAIPAGVEVYEINGPFFFGVAGRFRDKIRAVERTPQVMILRLRHVPIIDSTALHALEELYDSLKRQGTTVFFTGVQPALMNLFHRVGFDRHVGLNNFIPNIDEALSVAAKFVEGQQRV